jgi:DNA modification methylase
VLKLKQRREPEGIELHFGNNMEVMNRLIKQGVKAQTCITSPPYWGQRDYSLCECAMERRGHQETSGLVGGGQPMKVDPDPDCEECGGTGKIKGMGKEVGREKTPEKFIEKILETCTLIHKLVADDGIFWLNIADTYNPKTGSLALIPEKLAIGLSYTGWIIRRDIIWAKGVSFCPKYSGSIMTESIKNRPTTSHEYIWMLTKQKDYYYDYDAVREKGIFPAGTLAAKGSQERAFQGVNARPTEYAEYDGWRNLRSVWTIPKRASDVKHYATFPSSLLKPMILASTKPGQIVFDPFGGAGTTGLAAWRLKRRALLIELSPKYIKMARKRLKDYQFNFHGPLFQ